MKIEDLKRIQELFDKMSDEDKNRLNTLLLTCKEEYTVDPFETVKRCIQEMEKQEIEKAVKNINYEMEQASQEFSKLFNYNSKNI